MRQLLLAALGAAGSLLLDLPALAQISNTTSTFSGEVAPTCSISGLNSDYSLSPNSGYLQTDGYYQNFQIDSNSSVEMSTKYQIISEPPGFAPTVRKVDIRQVLNGNSYSFVSSARVPNTSSSAISLQDTPGTASAQVRMFIGPNLLPGTYSYLVTISCLQ